MMNYFLKSHLRKLYIPLIVIGTLLVIGTILINVFFYTQKPLIEDALSAISEKKVTIGHVVFLPLSTIFVLDLALYDQNETNRNTASIKKIKIQFSPCALLFNRDIVVQHLLVSDSKLSVDQLIFTLRTIVVNALKFKEFEVVVSPDSIQLSRIQLFFPSREKAFKKVVLHTKIVSTPSGNVTSRGIVHMADEGRIPGIEQQDQPVHFLFRGQRRRNALDIERITIQQGLTESRVWGTLDDFQEPFFDLRGYVKQVKERAYVGEPTVFLRSASRVVSRVKSWLKNFILHKKLFLPEAKLRPIISTLNIGGVTVKIKMKDDMITIEELSGLLGNLFVEIEGKFFNFEAPQFDASLFAHQIGLIPEEERETRFKVDLKGAIDSAALNGIAQLWTSPQLGVTPQTEAAVTVDFKRFRFDFDPEYTSQMMNLLIFADKIGFKMRDRVGPFDFHDVSSRIRLLQNKLFLDKLEATCAEGTVTMSGFVNSTPPTVSKVYAMQLKDLEVARLVEKLDTQIQLDGNLEGECFFREIITPNFTGMVTVRQGTVKATKMIQEIAKFFRLDALNEINFDKIYVDFAVDQDKIHLKKIQFDSQDITCMMSYQQTKDKKVSGQLQVSLSNELMRQSSNLRLLLKILREKSPYIKFTFEIGGVAENVYIRWLESDFKKQVESLLPVKMQKGMEQEIERAAAALSGGNE